MNVSGSVANVCGGSKRILNRRHKIAEDRRGFNDLDGLDAPLENVLG